MADAALTIVILRDLQGRFSAFERDMHHVKGDLHTLQEQAQITNQRLSLLEGRVEVTNQRLSVVETTVAEAAKLIRVATSHLSSAKTDHEEIEELKDRVSRLEDLVKP